MNTTALPIADDGPRPRKGPLAWMIVTQLFVALSLLPWVLVAGLSIMAFDAGVPTDPAMWALLAVVYGYPFYSLALAVGAWMAYRRGKTRRAVVLSTILIVPAIAVTYYLVWAASPPA